MLINLITPPELIYYVKFNRYNFPPPLIALHMNNPTVNKAPDIMGFKDPRR
jgi:hypothetical protein